MSQQNMKKRGLGMGLVNLLGQHDYNISPESSANNTQLEVDINNIITNPHQPRKYFNEETLQQLAKSIANHGIIQPIIVCRVDGKLQIIAGERRYRAAKIAGLNTVPVIIIHHDSEQKMLEVSILENIQRQDLSPTEEAMAYHALIDNFAYTHESLAASLGKSRSYISNMIRLLNLPQTVLDALHRGQLTVGHAKILLSTTNQEALAEYIIGLKLSVRQLENLLKTQSIKTSTQDDRNIKTDDIATKDSALDIHEADKGRPNSHITTLLSDLGNYDEMNLKSDDACNVDKNAQDIIDFSKTSDYKKLISEITTLMSKHLSTSVTLSISKDSEIAICVNGGTDVNDMLLTLKSILTMCRSA